MLYIVPTPIGNLQDMTLRGVEILKSVDLILAEDTRVTGKLLKYFEIDKPLRSFHANNEHKVLENIGGQLQSGTTMALVSDAGTPAISDPGFLLTRYCREHNIAVNCLPGATAFVPALVVSGLPANRFHFEGFLPAKKGRQTRITYLSQLESTIVLYESPHKIIKCLGQLNDIMGDRQATLCREISKLYEEIIHGSFTEIKAKLEEKDKVKGEIVLVVAGLG